MSQQIPKTLFPKTSFQQQIESSLKTTSLKDVAQKMGYSPKAFHARLKNHLANNFLGLDNGSYDLKYSGTEFVKALAVALDIDPCIVNSSLENIDDHLTKCQHSPAKIFVVTDFSIKKRTMPIFALAAMESGRRKTFNCDEFVNDENQMLEIVSKWVQQHYSDSQGVLPVWGTIESYLYTSAMGENYVFQADGSFKPQNQVQTMPNESRAVISI